MTWKSFVLVLRRTIIATCENGGFGVAKGAAFSALLSFLPVLATAVAILVRTRAEFVSRTIADFLFEVVPPGTQELVQYQFTVKGQRPASLLVVAGVLAIWAASGVVGSLIGGFQAAYHVKRTRPLHRRIAVSMMLVIFSGGPLLAACGLMFFGTYVDGLVMSVLAVDPLFSPVAMWWHLVTRLARYTVAFGATVAVTMLLYYFGPYRRQRWRRVWRGAVLATIFWLLAAAGFGWYVRNIANYNVLYRSIATSITLLVWMYLMSLIALLGCEFNAEYERIVLGVEPSKQN